MDTIDRALIAIENVLRNISDDELKKILQEVDDMDNLYYTKNEINNLIKELFVWYPFQFDDSSCGDGNRTLNELKSFMVRLKDGSLSSAEILRYDNDIECFHQYDIMVHNKWAKYDEDDNPIVEYMLVSYEHKYD